MGDKQQAAKATKETQSLAKTEPAVNSQLEWLPELGEQALLQKGLPGSDAARPLRQAAVQRLQHRLGNVSVQRFLEQTQPRNGDLIQRDMDEELAERPGTATGDLLQRHTAVELEEPENAVQAKLDADWGTLRQVQSEEETEPTVQRVTAAPGSLIQRNLTDDLNRAMSGWSTDSAAIMRLINNAPAAERQAALRDPRLIARLRDKLSRGDAIRALEGLGAPLVQRLEVAMSGWGADSAAILRMINSAPADQKQVVLQNPTIMARLRDELNRADAIRAMEGLGASLAERLYAAMQGWGVDAAAVIRLARNASDAEKQAALHDRALIDRLKSELNRAQMLNVLEQLGASIVDRLNVAMDGWGVDSAAILTIAQNATEAQKREALDDATLIARLGSELSRADMQTVLTRLGASLADRLNVAMDGWGADAATILAIIPTAEEAERLAAHDDVALIARLQSELSEDLYWQARLLLRFGSQAVIDAPSTAVPAIPNGIHYRTNAHIEASEWTQALAVMVRHLESTGALDSSQYTEMAYDAAGGGEGLTTVSGYNYDAAANRWTVASTPRVTVHPVGFTDVGWLYSTIMHEYQHVLQFNAGYNNDPNSAVVIASDEVEAYLWEIENANQTGVINNPAQLHDVGNRLTGHFNALDAAHQATYQARYNAAMAVVNAVPLPAGGAGAGAAAPQSLTAKLTTELENAPPDTAKMLADIAAATAADQELVRNNSSLMRRLAAVFNQADMRHAMNLLGVSMVNRLSLLLDQSASKTDILALINGGTAEEKATILANRALVDRLLAHLNQADGLEVLAALEDTLGNRIGHALTGTVNETAIFDMIRAAEAAMRSEVALNSELMNRLRAALTALSYWKVRLLLEYGAEASFPASVTTMWTALQGNPSAADIRRTIANLSTPDYTILKDVVGIREVLRALITNDDDYMFILRMLDQGLIAEETDISETYSETLLVDDPDTPQLDWTPRQFSGTRGFDVAYYRDRLQVDVRIKLNPVDDTARGDLTALQSLWEPMIENAWDNKFSLRNAVHTLPIRVNCNFTGSNPHHTVNVHSTAVVSWPGYNVNNWYYNAPNYSADSPVHEFGHMLGNPDEYQLSRADYQTTVGVDPTTDPNATASAADVAGVQHYTNTASAMGSGGPIQRRHLNYFANWINTHRRRNADNSFAEPAFTLV